MMRKIFMVSIIFVVFFVGCDSLRFAPSEEQKQNAWLHNRTTMIAADLADEGNASDKLRAVTKLSELQSRAFISYCGLPKELPDAKTAEDILNDTSYNLARTAISQSAGRPDIWKMADSGFELAIAVSALIGGIYGTKAVRFLKEARSKSKALKEIIEGNELFKKLNADQSDAFKQAQKNQSPDTKKLVAEYKV